MFYQWILFCTIKGFNNDEVKNIETEHIERLKKDIQNNVTGTIELTIADKKELEMKLMSNSGSKDSIKFLRKWILERSHSIISIGEIIKSFVINISSSKSSFNLILFTIYAINDILHNCKGIIISGPYTKILFHHKVLSKHPVSIDVKSSLYPYLPVIFHRAYALADGNNSDCEKLKKMATQWVSKELIEANVGKVLETAMENHFNPQYISPIAEPNFELISPYPLSLVPNQFIVNTHDGIEVPTVDEQQQQVILIQQQIQDQIAKIQQQQQQLSRQNSLENANKLSQFEQMVNNINKSVLSSSSSSMPPPPQMMMMPPPYYPPPFSQTPPPFIAMGLPPMPLPIAPPPVVTIDLHRIPVGTMATIVKNCLKSGHPPYRPIDTRKLPSANMSLGEVGRLETRVGDFYKKLKKILDPNDNQTSSSKESKSSFGFGDDNILSKGLTTIGKKHPRPMIDLLPMVPQQPEAEISEENVGHKLLRSYGWQQGDGLGVDNSGIVEPIREDKSKLGKDRTGLGVASDVAADNSISAYRKHMSSAFYQRISDRDR